MARSGRKPRQSLWDTCMAAMVQPLTQQLELAHILFLDIAASSSLPASQQREMQHYLQEFVRRTGEVARARARDQITVVPSGNGIALVFFGDPEAPLRCAVEISHTPRTEKRIHFRMGLHSGPVCRAADIKFNSDVSDGGISIAQRVMDYGD